MSGGKDREKPIIGVVPLIDEQKDSYWMLPGYMTGVEEAGGLPVMLPLTTDRQNIASILRTCNGFLFTGGQDISPELYGETAISECGENIEQRDKMELLLFRQAVEADKPILGICRGIQFFNVALGGTLYQDLPTQHSSDVLHCQKPPYEKPVHEVSLVKGSPLSELLNCAKIPVNSYHHQGIKDLAGQLRAMAFSDDDLVEAVYMPGKSFVWAVQWHPELSYREDANSRKLFHTFVRMCENKDK